MQSRLKKSTFKEFRTNYFFFKTKFILYNSVIIQNQNQPFGNASVLAIAPSEKSDDLLTFALKA